MEIQVNNTDECIKSFALSIYSDVQKYIEEHMEEFIEWHKKQEEGKNKVPP